MKALREKIARLRNGYLAAGLPTDPRHTMELVEDLADIIDALDERLKNVEGRVNYIADKTA